MVESIADMPAGTLGFMISGKLTSARVFSRVLSSPSRRRWSKRARSLSFLIATADDFDGLDAGALWEDVKAAGSVGLKYRSSWDRLAVVTDKDWMRNAIAAFGWISPGELKVFEPYEFDAAKAWVGGADAQAST